MMLRSSLAVKERFVCFLSILNISGLYFFLGLSFFHGCEFDLKAVDVNVIF